MRFGFRCSLPFERHIRFPFSAALHHRGERKIRRRNSRRCWHTIIVYCYNKVQLHFLCRSAVVPPFFMPHSIASHLLPHAQVRLSMRVLLLSSLSLSLSPLSFSMMSMMAMDPWILALNFPLMFTWLLLDHVDHLAIGEVFALHSSFCSRPRGDCHLTFEIECEWEWDNGYGWRWRRWRCPALNGLGRRVVVPFPIALTFPVNCNLFQSYFNRYLCFVFHSSSCGAFNAYISGHFNKLSCLLFFTQLLLLLFCTRFVDSWKWNCWNGHHRFQLVFGLSLCMHTVRMLDIWANFKLFSANSDKRFTIFPLYEFPSLSLKII